MSPERDGDVEGEHRPRLGHPGLSAGGDKLASSATGGAVAPPAARREDDAMAARFTRSDDLEGARFSGVDLRGAQFTGVDLTGARFAEAYLPEVVMRGVEVRGADIDAPWLADGGAAFMSTASTSPRSSTPS
ncbi:MAG: pentapeptide repeat-containing protein [Dermatophilaceae bacterium]